MPLAPHRDVTDEQLEACRRLGRPAPPLGSERWSEDGFDVFVFHHPGEKPPPGAPTAFRWRFKDGYLVGFFAYGWQDHIPEPPRKGRRRAKGPTRIYALFTDDRRDVEAKTLMEDGDAAD